MSTKQQDTTPSPISSLPNSKESEMMVLGCMLTSVNSLNIAADSLHYSDFYFPENQLVFKALKQAYLSDKPADVHLIAEELKKAGELKQAGGVAYLTTLAQYAATSAYIEEYVEIIKNKSTLRKMIEAAKKIEKEAVEAKQEVSTLLDEAQGLFFTISQSANSTIGLHVKDLLSGLHSEEKLPYLKQLQEKQELFLKQGSIQQVPGLPTLFNDLDKTINGLNPANLIILAARPSMGKTAFALNIAENICFKHKKAVAIFSLEMTAEELLHRMICSQAEVESEKIKSGSVDGVEFQRIVAAVHNMQKHTLIIDDQPGLKVTDLRARARRLREMHNIDLIIIDYLQLLSGSRPNYSPDNRQNEISEISRMLKNLAREIKIPIICLSQLSRKVEERSGHRPMLSDLRESGCLAGDTLIEDAETGIHYTIKELAQRKNQKPFYVYAIDENLKMGKHKMTKVFYSGQKMTYELKTRSGRVIKASANHPFRKLEGWVALENLRVGDRIAIPMPLSLKTSYILPKQPYYCTTIDELHAGISPNQISLFQSTNGNLTKYYIHWDEIVSVTELQIEDVYDATVEGVHNFVANDIIVHNSIEQDADIVMFLFRPEYYNSQHKPGIAEVIVAKNRHGKVGNVQLTFRKSIAQFQNYTPMEGEAPFPSDEADPFAAFNSN